MSAGSKGSRPLVCVTFVTACALFTAATSCESTYGTVLVRPAPELRAPWSCPEGWVQYEHGGCGPGVLLCPNQGAAAGACPERDPLSHEERIERTGFYRTADGVIHGGWSLRAERAAQGRSPCPDRWRSDSDGACTPVELSCAEDSPSYGTGCLAVGMATCSSGVFATAAAPAGATVLYVLATAPSGGDGSRERPFQTLDSALHTVSGTTWIYLGAGRYTAGVTLDAPVHLIGVCPTETILVGTDRATITVNTGANAALTGLTVNGGQPGIDVRPSAALTLDRVVIDSARGYGLIASGVRASVTAKELLVRNVLIQGLRTASGIEIPAAAVAVTGGATVRLEHTVLRDNSDLGAAVSDQAELRITDSVIEGTHRRTLAGTDQFENCNGGEPDTPLAAFSQQSGSAIVALRRGRLIGERLLIRNNHWVSVWASGTSTTATLKDSVVRDTQPDHRTRMGKGLEADRGATFDVIGSLIDHNTDVGASGYCPGTRLTLTDSVVRNTQMEISNTRGRGVDAQYGATVVIDRSVIANNHEAGVFAFSSGSMVEIRESVLRDTQLAPGAPVRSGYGAAVLGGGAISIERSLVMGNRNAGIGAYLPSSRITLQRVLVLNTIEASNGWGIGVGAGDGAEVIADKLGIQDAVAGGVAAMNLTRAPIPTITVNDLFVRRVGVGRANVDGGVVETGGYGLHLDRHSRMTLSRVVVTETPWGIVIFGDPLGTITWTDGVLSLLDHAGAWQSTATSLESALHWARVSTTRVTTPTITREPSLRSLRE